MTKSPFKFLDSYTKDDSEVFFGRDREIGELYQKVFDSKLLLVYGVSGTGKSSLIHCGLANKFQESDWLPIVIRRGANIIDGMAAVINSVSITKLEKSVQSPGEFRKAVRSLYLDYYKPIYFIFDQFEELFIFGTKVEKHAFVQIIKSLLESDLQCRFVFILREEYMANITEFERSIPTIFTNRVRVEKMSHRNALEAIKEPCKVFNISLEEGFAETLLERLSPGSTEVELTFLQVYLDKIFRLAQNEKKSGENNDQLTFTLSVLQKTGNVSDLLGSFLDDQIALMDDPDTAMTVLKAFVSGKGTKRPANETETIDNVRSLGKEISHELVTELLQTFVNLRVLRDKDDHGRYELRHDSLAEKIFDKFSLAEKELLEIRQFIENAYQSYLKRKILLSHDDLEYISNKDSLLNLNPELMSFLHESRKHQIAEKRTVRRLTIFSAVGFVLLLCILGYFVYTKISQVNADYIAIKSLSQILNPITRLRAAGQGAWKKNPGVIPKEALIKSFNDILLSQEKDSVMNLISEQYNLIFDPAPVYIQFAKCSKDNKYIYGYGDSLLFIWNTLGHLEKTFRTGHFPIVDMKISDDDNFIGTASIDSILTVWDFDGNLQFTYRLQYNGLNTKQMFKFTKDSNVIALSREHDAVLLDKDGKELQVFDRHRKRVNAVDISPDNNFIATASSDTTINIWYYNSVKNRFDFYNRLNWHNDTIWSVSFSNNSVRVVTASADSNCVIGTINNHWEYRQFGYQKICNAEFSSSNSGIIYTRYQYINRKVIKSFFGLNYINPRIYIESGWFGNEYDGFSSLVFSNNEDYFACSLEKKVYLADNRLAIEKDTKRIRSTYTLLKINGSDPFFSPDSKHFFYIDQNIIRSYLIDIETINKAAWSY